MLFDETLVTFQGPWEGPSFFNRKNIVASIGEIRAGRWVSFSKTGSTSIFLRDILGDSSRRTAAPLKSLAKGVRCCRRVRECVIQRREMRFGDLAPKIFVAWSALFGRNLNHGALFNRQLFATVSKNFVEKRLCLTLFLARSRAEFTTRNFLFFKVGDFKIRFKLSLRFIRLRGFETGELLKVAFCIKCFIFRRARIAGIEPAYMILKTTVLPLNYIPRQYNIIVN